MKPTSTFLFALLLLTACGASSASSARSRAAGDQDPSAPQDPATQQRNEQLQTARRHLNAGELDAALDITDAVLAATPDDRDARVLAAQGNIGMFQEGRPYAENFLQDAKRNLELTLKNEAEDPEALELLSWCQLKLGKFERGSEAALEAAGYFKAQQAGGEKIARALLQAAECQLQILADVRNQEKASGAERPGDDSNEAAQRVLGTLRMSQSAKPLALSEVRTADVYLWMDRPKQAIVTLEDAIRINPAANDLHVKLQALYFQMSMYGECVTYYRNLLDDLEGSGAVRWYLGRAQVAHADSFRRKSQSDEATRAYLRARDAFRAYDEQKRSDHETTAQWIAICELSLARVAFESGDLDVASEHYEAAFRSTELVTRYYDNGYPVVTDSFGGNYLGGLIMIGSTLAEQSDQDALRRALAFWDTVIERHPDRFGQIYNNGALSARDLGVAVMQRAQNGDETASAEEAMQLWEKSYRYYEKAVPLAPDDPRIINDCGLMLVYYLNRDYDRAREMFETAIDIGQPQLDALDPTDDSEAAAAQRQFLEEAIGDAHQNMGRMLLLNLNQPAESRPWLEKALNYYPYQQREARLLLQRSAGESTGPDPAKQAAFAAFEQRANAAVADGDLDTALAVLDEAAADFKDYAPWNAMTGALTLRFTNERVASGNTNNFVTQGFEDAVRLLRRAVELDSGPNEPRLALAEAHLAAGQARKAAEVADALLLHVQSGGGTDASMMAKIHRSRAMGATQAYIASRQNSDAAARDQSVEAELLRQARSSFREIETTDSFGATEQRLWTTLERWAEAPTQALAVAQRAYERDPSQVAAFQQLGTELNLNAEVAAALASSDDATVRWYRGRALYSQAIDLWSGGEGDPALTVLDEARADFDKVIEKNPDFRDSSEQWVAYCRGFKGAILAARGERDTARIELLAAAKARPDIAQADLGVGTSIRRELFTIGDSYYQQGDLEQASGLFAEAGEALPEDGTFANNHGLFARDYAIELQRAGENDKAKTYYEASYAAYTRAHQLAPGDLRVRNDRALLLVYYLKRDYEIAEELFRSVMKDGDERLQNDPPEDAGELQNLQEAVGDAYGNLGYHFMANVDRYADAEPLLEKAIDYYPGRQRAAVGRLQRVREHLKGGR